MGAYPADTPEGDRMAAWGMTGRDERVYDKGLLRDVYPWSFLTASQFAAPIDGVPLWKWIEQDARRGTISEFMPGTMLWEVPDDRIADVRFALAHAG